MISSYKNNFYTKKNYWIKFKIHSLLDLTENNNRIKKYVGNKDILLFYNTRSFSLIYNELLDINCFNKFIIKYKSSRNKKEWHEKIFNSQLGSRRYEIKLYDNYLNISINTCLYMTR